MKNCYIDLLCRLIETPSVSRQEHDTADILAEFLTSNGVAQIHRKGNNVWAYNRHFDYSLPTILLNSHHDTVAPCASYTRDPYQATLHDDRLYGLGANDAGGSVVALTATFLHFYQARNLKYNLCLALVGEEECSGDNGLRSILSDLGKIDFAIIGEPTQMKMAIGERGLMVLDCVAHGRSGHAARGEGVNAIYLAMQDIAWVSTYQFSRVSELFGSVKMTVTIINAGTVHNVVPSECHFTIDVRVSEQYSLQQVFDTIQDHLASTVMARSMRLNPSSISLDHPMVRIGLDMGVDYYGSPTTSDAAVLSPLPCLKMGPGDSARSHTADEYIVVQEVMGAIDQYRQMLERLIVE